MVRTSYINGQHGVVLYEDCIDLISRGVNSHNHARGTSKKDTLNIKFPGPCCEVSCGTISCM